MIYPEFIDNDIFFLMDDSKTEKDQLMALSKNLKTLQTLKTTDFSTFHELISKYLSAGLQIFDMKIGIVSEINGEDYTVCNCVSEIDPIVDGTTFSLEGTYCREVVKTNSVIGLPHVGLLMEMKNHPVYVNMKLESYISAPIIVENELFGTLNFSSTIPRKFGFSEHERDFITMMSNSIATFLKFEKKENDLRKSTERMKQLVGYVAHDLRGPLSNIKTLASFIKSKEHQDIVGMIQKSSEKALEFVYAILETAAMGSGKIKLEIENHNISKLLIERYEYYSSFKKEKKLKWSVNIEPDLILPFDKDRILQVFDNLLSNCAKYTPIGGDIKVDLKRSNEQFIQLQIINTVAQNPFTNKFDIKNSVGFGQEIVKEILKLHNSTLDIAVNNNTYTVQFKLNSVGVVND